MKKLTVALLLGGLLALFALPVSGQRGDLYGARALLALEQAFKTTGVLTFPNYPAAPVVCNAANRGVYYYDTTTTDINICGAAGWVAVSAGFTVGTANTIPKWNAVPDDLVDTFLVEAGIPAAGAGGSVLAQTTTLNAMDGADTIALVDLVITNADHTGANNFLTGLNIWGVIGDDQASEYGIQVGTGWDAQVWGNTTTLMMGSDLNVVSLLDDTFGVVVSWDLEQLAGEVNRWETIVANLAIMDGVGIDTATGLNIAMTNANHTDAGAGVFVYGLNISDLGGGADPDATEHAINIGNGWDQDIYFDTSGQIESGGNLNVLLANDGIFYVGDSVGSMLTVNDSGNSIQFAMENGNVSRGRLLLNNRPDAGAGGNIALLDANLNAMNGTDTVRGLYIDLLNANHGGATNFLYGLDIDGIVADPDATESAINIGDGWDREIYFEGMSPEIRFPDGGILTMTMTSGGGATRLAINTSTTRTVGADWVGSVIDIDHGLTTFMSLTPTLAANDNANDQRNVLLIDIDIPNGSAGLINGINIDGVTDDTDTIDSAIFIEGGWDYALTITDRGGVATNNPLTGTAGIFMDDDADYSGGGGNDCAIVAREAGGTNVVIAILVLNGACN